MAKKTDPEKLKTRPDLGDMEWIVWTAAQPENRGIDVHAMYRKMLEWCNQKGVTPTRRRLLKWLDGDREAMPMTYEPAYLEKPAADPKPSKTREPDPPCEICGEEFCFNLHRAERGI